MTTAQVFLALGVALCAVAPPAMAQAADPPPAPTRSHVMADTASFLAGAAVALGAHEAGHLAFDVVFQADPTLKAVHFGPFPFFAVTHSSDVSPRREFTISSAGFWMQEATDEWLLTSRPALRREHAPFVKGLLVFNVLNSIGYAGVAFFRAGPYERDTRGMTATGIDERAIGLMVLAPAVLDAYRYMRPSARWAAWASRAAKVGSVVMVVKKTD